MSLKIYHCSRIEDLAEKLVGELTAERAAKGPFEFLKVAVANPNLGNWLKMKVLAKVPGLSAGVEMPFLNDELERILKENDSLGGEIVSGRDYPAIILNILMTDEREEFVPFCKYIKEKNYKSGQLTILSQREAKRAVQLANTLGQLIDDYEATGYLPLLKEFKDRSDIFKGEQALVEELKDVRSQRKAFEALRNSVPKGPSERVILFGHTLLTSLQREVVEWAAKTHEVIWYRPEEKTSVEDGVELRVVGAPGIRREVEMVHERILDIVWDHNQDGKPIQKEGVNFSDIAVLVTDMPKYRAIIESVFDGRGQIPFGLVDATTSDYSSYLDGFLALMDIARYGLSRGRIFAALSNPCVQRAMVFSRDDVAEWRKLADRIGAFEGFAEADSDEKNVSGRFNWEWALKRLRLGLVAEEVDGMELEALDEENVGKFSEVVETLYRRLSGLNEIRAKCSSENTEQWPETWAGRLHAIMKEFLAVDKEDSLESLVRAGIIRTLNSLVRIEGEQNFRLPVAVVESSVAGVECAKGGYLRHGVTIGGLRSLAHVPFKYIFVIGLLESTIPGKNDRSTLDVRNELLDEDREDTLRAAKSRAQFMAAVSSARKELVLSYPCLDLQSDATLYPSSLVHEVATGVEIAHYPLEEPPRNAPDVMIDPVQGMEPDKETPSEPSAKDFAAFVRDPYNGVFSRRFKIANEEWRANSIGEGTPLGVHSYGQTRWDLEKAMILQELDTVYETSQKVARLPQSYLGEFAHKKIARHQPWADGNVTNEDRAWLRGEREDEHFELLCRNYKSAIDGELIFIPPAAVLESFYGFLARHIESRSPENLKFKIRVIAFDNVVQTWAWDIPANEVLKHVKTAKEWYGKVPPAVTYDNLRESLRSIANAPKEDGQNLWNVLAQSIPISGSRLVIDKVLDRWRRPPTGEELKKMYEEIFKLPMSGKLVQEGEVQNV